MRQKNVPVCCFKTISELLLSIIRPLMYSFQECLLRKTDDDFLPILSLVVVCNRWWWRHLQTPQQNSLRSSRACTAWTGGGLSTQPCGWASVEEVWPPIRTDWGLFVRKSTIHLHSVVLKPRVLSLSSLISFVGENSIEYWAEIKKQKCHQWHQLAGVHSTRPGMLSGPAALFTFTLSGVLLTSAVDADSGPLEMGPTWQLTFFVVFVIDWTTNRHQNAFDTKTLSCYLQIRHSYADICL